jgi:hypothetical protein
MAAMAAEATSPMPPWRARRRCAVAVRGGTRWAGGSVNAPVLGVAMMRAMHASVSVPVGSA